MKKSYETPSVEKIKFNYRDQVVAASGTLNSGTSDQDIDNPSTGEVIIGRIAEGLSINGCSDFRCDSLMDIWA